MSVERRPPLIEIGPSGWSDFPGIERRPDLSALVYGPPTRSPTDQMHQFGLQSQLGRSLSCWDARLATLGTDGVASQHFQPVTPHRTSRVHQAWRHNMLLVSTNVWRAEIKRALAL